MRDTLFIRIGTTERVTWLREGDPAQVVEGLLAEAAAIAAGRQVVMLVPGADVLLMDVAVPTRNRSRMATAVPYLLEEQLAADVEDSHFALGERDAQGRVAVAVVSRNCMDAWLARLAEAGLKADKLIPESLLLPFREGAWSVLVERDGVTVRTALQGAMTLDNANTAFMLQRALAEVEIKPAALRVWRVENVTDAVIPDEPNVEVIRETLTVPPLALLAGQIPESAALDLLQGTYSRRERLGKMWRPWRPAAGLLAAWLVLQLGIMIYHYRELRIEEARLREDVSRIYLQTFPDAKRVVNARAQMEQRLAALRGGPDDVGDFIKMLGAVSGPATAFGGVEINRLSYKEGEINISLAISDLQRLDQFKERLSSETHMIVEIQSAATRNSGVEASIRVKGGTS